MAKSASTALSGIDFLLKGNLPLGRLVAISGDEAYLKREVIHAIRRKCCPEEQDDFGWNVYTGKESEWRDVSDALTSVSLFGSGDQAALVEEADTFVTQFRSQLEDYVERSSGGVLILDIKAWPGNTRLAKAVASRGLAIKCQVPDRGIEKTAYERSARKWLIDRGKSHHKVTLTDSACDVLFDLLPMSLGVMDQEVARLALLVEPGAAIEPKLVQENVGGWRTQKTWDMIDAAAEGRAADAIQQLERLLIAGEQPIGLLAQVSSTLRRFASATCLIEHGEKTGRRIGLQQALEQAGVTKFKLGDAQRQLKQIGRERARQLDAWLLEADLALKGYNSTPARGRGELERLIGRLSREARVLPAAR